VYIFSSGLYSPGGAYVYDSSVLSMHIAAPTALPIFFVFFILFYSHLENKNENGGRTGGLSARAPPKIKKYEERK
jgi:hypothetical protein